MKELVKDCPFCGSMAQLAFWSDGKFQFAFIKCCHCNARGSSFGRDLDTPPGKTAEDIADILTSAKSAWNDAPRHRENPWWRVKRFFYRLWRDVTTARRKALMFSRKRPCATCPFRKGQGDHPQPCAPCSSLEV